MARHDAIVAEVLAGHGGWRPTDQGEGDSAFLAFTGPRAAVAAALELQLRLQSEPWPAQAQLTVRIAVGAGEVYPRDGNLYGDPVNRTARVRALGAGGQILVTAAVRELVAEDLPAGASLADLGAHRMKDLIHPEHVWQLQHPDLPSEFPALASLDAALHNLPLQSSSFVGRESDLADLVELLRGSARLVTITGFGGIGKTRLALQAGAELTGSAADGVWFVDCSSVSGIDEVPVAVASALGVRDPGLGMAGAVLDSLRERALILVLDNLHSAQP